MLNDELGGARCAKARGGSPASLWVYVDDCDALFERAIDAGAREAGGSMGRIQDQFWRDRCGMLVDPEGYSWTIATRKEDLTPQEMQQRHEAFMKNLAPQSTPQSTRG